LETYFWFTGERTVARSRIQLLALTACLAALTAVCSLIALPNPLLPAVPFTLQVLAVCLAGALLPPRWAIASQVVYLLLGVLGLPVFAGGAAGPAVLFSATGGFLWGFPFGAGVIAAMGGTRPGWWRAATAGVCGILVIYAFGLAGVIAFGHAPLSLPTIAGILSFLPWDLAKAIFAVAIAARVRPALAPTTA